MTQQRLQGGFLGLDNISLFDRSSSIRREASRSSRWNRLDGLLLYSDATHFATFGLRRASLPRHRHKFFEHFLRIAGAMTNCGGKDTLSGILRTVSSMMHYIFLTTRSFPKGPFPCRAASLLAVETLEEESMKKQTTFSRRVDWFVSKRSHVFANLTCIYRPG